MKTIRLTRGQVAIIDDEDADLCEFKWYAKKDIKTFYAARAARNTDGSRTTQVIHQIIASRMGIPGPPDHVDRDGLNNTRANLRPANNSQSSANRGLQRNNTSGFKGVCWHNGCGKWRAEIKVDGKKRSLGYHATAESAALAYDRAARATFGAYAVVNFPAVLGEPRVCGALAINGSPCTRPPHADDPDCWHSDGRGYVWFTPTGAEPPSPTPEYHATGGNPPPEVLKLVQQEYERRFPACEECGGNGWINGPVEDDARYCDACNGTGRPTGAKPGTGKP